MASMSLGFKKAKKERGCTSKERISETLLCTAGKKSSTYRGVTREIELMIGNVIVRFREMLCHLESLIVLTIILMPIMHRRTGASDDRGAEEDAKVEDAGTELKTLEDTSKATEPYKSPNSGVTKRKEKQISSSSSTFSALSNLSASPAYRSLEEKVLKIQALTVVTTIREMFLEMIT
ncbi:hypothetical protein Bca4012_037817 [Brassica carinata]